MTVAPSTLIKPGFKPIHGYSQWVTAIFVLQALLVSVLILTNKTSVALTGVESLTESEALTLFGILAVNLLYLASSIASAVLFLVWIYRAYSNLPVLGTPNPRFTPGWAVAWFFIPVMSLFRPFQVVHEIWKTSDPRTVTTGFDAAGGASSAWMVGLWWFLFLLGNYMSWWNFIAESDSLTMAIYLIDIVGIIVTILMVWQISRFQHQKFESLRNMN